MNGELKTFSGYKLSRMQNILENFLVINSGNDCLHSLYCNHHSVFFNSITERGYYSLSTTVDPITQVFAVMNFQYSETCLKRTSWEPILLSALDRYPI